MRRTVSCILSVLCFFSLQEILACDPVLLPYPRDCALQDQLRQIRFEMTAQGKNLDEVAEYRALRFIDRVSWEKAKAAEMGPRWIYDKKPMTWDQWDSGIRWIEGHVQISELSLEKFSQIHQHLMNKEIQAQHTDRNFDPGVFRGSGSALTGFCFPTCQAGKCQSQAFIEEHLNNLEKSERRSQDNWERQVGNRLGFLFAELDISSPALNYAPLRFDLRPSELCQGIWVSYLAGAQVQDHLKMWLKFLKFNLQRIDSGQSHLSPIELASDMQKWMVGIHPFSDGNGRFSRALQDLILRKYNLPFAPSGDLYNDVFLSREEYRELTYQKTQEMLNFLEKCTGSNKFPCQSVIELSERGQP